jgi:N-ethylmaleimide reductase
MAPLTRSRADERNAPTALNATYYAQRASAAFIVTECTQVSPQGMAYPSTPGIHSEPQVAGWRLVTDAVHAQGGRIFLQIWHGGRVSHPSLQPDGELPVAPSAIVITEGEAFTSDGPVPFVAPRALATEEIPAIVDQFRKAAENAFTAGFDGVEIHGANGYLIDQFLHDGSNQRTDRYGGSIQNRSRFLFEITEAVTGVWGAHRVGLRLSPGSNWMSMYDSDLLTLFTHVVKELSRFGLAYLSLIEPTIAGNVTIDADPSALTVKQFRSIYDGTLIAAGDYDRESGNAALAASHVDLVKFGRFFIANPDLPERFATNASLQWPDRATFYGGGGEGYTDYPSLRDEEAFREIRERVLFRDARLGEAFDAGEVAARLHLEPESAAYALNRLSAEGLVLEVEPGRFGVAPIDATVADNAFDARCAIELGVAELTVGRVSREQLDGLRRRLEAMRPFIRDDRFVDFPRYLAANSDYHEFLVGLAGNHALLDAYRVLSTKALMARSVGQREESSNKAIEVQVRLTEAYETSNLATAKVAIREYAALAKERARSALETVGGRT